MEPVFERATPDDAAALVKIQIAAFHDDARLYPGVEIGGPPGYNSLEAQLKKIAEAETYKIVVDGQIVGGIVVYNQGEGHYHLDLLYVDPAYHNRAIGSQAMTFIHQTYPATRWTLDTPGYATRNHHFYEKFGYVKTAEHVMDDGFVLVAYEKRM